MKGLNYIEERGEVIFYADEHGGFWQDRGDGNPFPVETKLLYIGTKKGYTIKYNANGVSGYCIYKDEKMIADEMWTLHEADQFVINLK